MVLFRAFFNSKPIPPGICLLLLTTPAVYKVFYLQFIDLDKVAFYFYCPPFYCSDDTTGKWIFHGLIFMIAVFDGAVVSLLHVRRIQSNYNANQSVVCVFFYFP